MQRCAVTAAAAWTSVLAILSPMFRRAVLSLSLSAFSLAILRGTMNYWFGCIAAPLVLQEDLLLGLGVNFGRSPRSAPSVLIECVCVCLLAALLSATTWHLAGEWACGCAFFEHCYGTRWEELCSFVRTGILGTRDRRKRASTKIRGFSNNLPDARRCIARRAFARVVRSVYTCIPWTLGPFLFFERVARGTVYDVGIQIGDTHARTHTHTHSCSSGIGLNGQRCACAGADIFSLVSKFCILYVLNYCISRATCSMLERIFIRPQCALCLCRTISLTWLANSLQVSNSTRAMRSKCEPGCGMRRGSRSCF